MTAAADTFAAFVTILADVMDDHEVGGKEIASRLYLSRFHFDRVISAVAGEAPSSFRRRVLLERAAYRLATTQNTILEVALEAG